VLLSVVIAAAAIVDLVVVFTFLLLLIHKVWLDSADPELCLMNR